MAESQTFPCDQHGWVILRDLGKKVRLRAVSIDIKGTVTDTDGHKIREAIAEGGVKVRSKLYDTRLFVW